jgi:HEPN domain-containing protein
MEQSRRNLHGAAVLNDAGEHGLACFTCQQAAEMALKGVLESRALDRSGYNLLDLVRQLEGAVTISAELRGALRRLNRLYIRRVTRTP